MLDERMDSSIKLVASDNPSHSRFEIDLGDSLAIADYRLEPGRITFTHTKVPPQHGGKGIGTILIRAALAAARERNLMVIPICPFFARYITKHAEEQDLLDPSCREKLGLD